MNQFITFKVADRITIIVPEDIKVSEVKKLKIYIKALIKISTKEQS
jgi:hypothetical protein